MRDRPGDRRALSNAGLCRGLPGSLRVCPIGADAGDDRADRNDVVDLEQALFHRTGSDRRYLRIDLIGGNFEDAFILPDAVAGLLEPLEDGGFHNTFTHFWHYQVDERHNELLDFAKGSYFQCIGRTPAPIRPTG